MVENVDNYLSHEVYYSSLWRQQNVLQGQGSLKPTSHANIFPSISILLRYAASVNPHNMK